MIKSLAKNYQVLIKYSRIYYIISVIIFMIFGTEELNNILQRVVIIVFISIGYLLFFNFSGFYLRVVKRKNKWEKVKKLANFQMNFFLVFFGIGMIMILIGALTNLKEITVFLLAINVVLGIITGVLKAKSLYIYEFEE